MKVLVTGGSGFIGSHLIDLLIESGYDVLNYDIESPKYQQNCEFVKGDVNDTERLISQSIGYDYIYHLAAESNVNRFFQSPVYSNLITSTSTINVLECTKKNNIKRVLLASTEWVYGSIEGRDDEMITEETPYAQNPDHIYTSSKIASELFCKNYYTLYGVNYTIMRYGIPFGERARPDTVTPIFINKILNNEEITVHGDGSQFRQFIYVKDLVKGNIACLHEEAENQIFNLNGKEMITVLDLIRTLEEILNKKAKIRFVDDRKGNFKGRYISSQKAKTLLQWEPVYNYKDAMKKYISNLLKEKYKDK